MKNRSGLTLIEVILAIAILSILLITYITAIGQNAIIVSKGKDFTSDTFDHQEIMENRIIDGKRKFIENKEKEDYKIEIFNGDYKSTIDTKEIKTDIKGNRQYIAYVTNYEIKEPESPKIDPFEVGVYDSKGNRVFPWYEIDDIRIKANYTLKPNPLIYENRIRWYRSKEGILNPVFASEYDIVYEEIQKEPNATTYIKELTKNNKNLNPKRFYYFEARPYTLAGRLEHFRNEDRILVLNRPGSPEWEKFMEEIYFKTVKIFNSDKSEIYLDIMQNPERPTLNLDWSSNEDPQGSLVGMKIPKDYINNNFQATVDFRVDSNTLLNADKLLGIGVGLVSENNSGLIISFDALKNSINIHETIENGKYKNIDSPIENINILNDDRFQVFKDKNNGNFDWNKEYSLIIQYFHNDKLKIKLKDDISESEFIEISIDNLNINPKYIGLKSYSNLDYKPDTRYEIVSKYDRNYSSHFYDIRFENISIDDNN